VHYSAPLLVASNLLLVVSLAAAKTALLSRNHGPVALTVLELGAAAGVAVGAAVVNGQSVFAADVAAEVRALVL